MTFIRKLAAGAIVAAATVLAGGAHAQQKPITLGFRRSARKARGAPRTPCR